MKMNVHHFQTNLLWHFLVFTLAATFMKLAVAVPVPVNWTHLSSANGDLPVPPVANGQVGMKVADFDNNGQNDYVMTFQNAAETVVWYRQLGNSFEKYVIDTEPQNLSHSEGFKDIDGDGDIDLIIGDAGSANQIHWWENPYPNYDPGTPWVRRVVHTSSENQFHDSTWGDFDDDGVEEYIAWNQRARQLLLFEVPTDPKTSGPWPVTPIFSWTGDDQRFRGTDIADINLDGKMDFVGGCGWFEHISGTTFVRHDIETEGHGTVKAGQLIEGGRPEVVCQLEAVAGPLNMYEWTGSSWQTQTLFAAGAIDRSHTLKLGDINQDGHLDIFTAEMGQWSQPGNPPTNPDAKTTVLYGDGAGNFVEQVVFAAQGHLEGQLADIDNDGDLDIVSKGYRHNMPRVDMWINDVVSPGPDITPPVISNVQVTLVTDSRVTVTWDTDEAADSVVDYGLTSGYGLTASDAARVTSHSVTLTGLAADSLHHYQVSSTDGSGNTASSVDLTFTTAASGGSPSGMVSDNFDGGVLDTDVWTFVDPVGDSSLAMTGSQAEIVVPAGTRHDVWKNDNNTAPRLRQATYDTDFVAEVKFDSALNQANQVQGLLAEQDNDNLIRFDFYSDGVVTRVFAASFVNGSPTIRVQTVITDSVPLYLRVSRVGDQWTQAYSYDGVIWIPAVTFTHSLVLSSVSVFGGNAGAPPPAHTALVDYFVVQGSGGDTTPPVISNIQVSVTDTTATVTWDTDELSDSVVDYGLTSGYGLTASDATPVTSHSVTLTGLPADTLHHYQVSSTDASSNTASSGDLTFTTVDPPAITTQPLSQTVNEGGSVTFTVAATGTPAPTYQWKKEGVDIAGATSASLTINPVSASDAADYTVDVTNTAGSVTSAVATLTVYVPPAITTEPSSRTVNEGDSVTFTVVATGTPAPTYQWKKEGVDIAGATSASLTINPVSASDAADYTVDVTNTAGSVTSAVATLTVYLAPGITTQPADQTVIEGATATFTVVATGIPAPTYQWQKNGVDIAGATSASYTTTATTVADDGATFQVVVANVVNSVTSSAATLTVTVMAPDGDLAPWGTPDGQINAADLLIMIRIVLGEITATPLDLLHGDLYPTGAPDGVIDMSDLIILQQLILLNGP